MLEKIKAKKKEWYSEGTLMDDIVKDKGLMKYILLTTFLASAGMMAAMAIAESSLMWKVIGANSGTFAMYAFYITAQKMLKNREGSLITMAFAIFVGSGVAGILIYFAATDNLWR